MEITENDEAEQKRRKELWNTRTDLGNSVTLSNITFVLHESQKKREKRGQKICLKK